MISDEGHIVVAMFTADDEEMFVYVMCCTCMSDP